MTFRPYPVPILHTVNRAQLGKWFSKLWSRWVNLERVSAATTVGEVGRTRGWGHQPALLRPYPSVLDTKSRLLGKRGAVARWEYICRNGGIQLLQEAFGQSPPRLPLALAPLCSSRGSIITQQLYGHPNSLKSLFLELAHLSRRKTGMKTNLKAGLYCLEPRFTWYLLTAFPSLVFN